MTAERAGAILVRTDGAGSSHAWVHHLTSGGFAYSTGFGVTDAVRDAITKMPVWVWTPAVDAIGGHRAGAQIAEVTGLLTLSGWPRGCG